MKRHPPGLYVLFGTEAAERFSFYTMRAILVLYLTRIIMPGGLATDETFRAEVTDALQSDAKAAYVDAAKSIDDDGAKLVNAALLTQAGLLAEITRDGLALDQPLSAEALANVQAEKPRIQELLASHLSGDELAKEKEELKNALAKAAAHEPLKEYADELASVAATPLAMDRFATAVAAQQSNLSAILDVGFDKQNLKGEEATAFAGQAITSLEGDGRGFAEWVAAYKIKRLIRPRALAIYGLYLLLVYLSGLIGGYVADKILGSRKAIIMGGIVMAGGLFTMWWPSMVFYGLALIIAGNAFFKPNISTIVSGLYPEGDKRRDPAFTIFYMGINLGAFIAIFGAGHAESMAQTHDWVWNVGFVLAGAGMIFSLILFQLGQRTLGTAGFPPGREVTKDSRLLGRDYRDVLLWALGVSLAAVLAILIWGVVGPLWTALPTIVRLLVGVALVGGAIYGLRQRSKKEGGEANEPLTVEEWQRVAVILILSVFVIFFWAGFEQAGGTMNLFAYEQTDRHIGSWEMPATWFQGFNPLFIIILAPLFSMLWTWNDKKSWGLSTPAKMGVGMIVLGLGFVIMYFGQAEADAQGKASLVWLVVVYLVHTVGELCLSPIGLSMVTKLSPVRIVSLMMGVWFACTAVADYLSGRLEEIVHHFGVSLWATLFTLPIGAGVVLLLLTPLLKKWMHDKA